MDVLSPVGKQISALPGLVSITLSEDDGTSISLLDANFVVPPSPCNASIYSSDSCDDSSRGFTEEEEDPVQTNLCFEGLTDWVDRDRLTVETHVTGIPNELFPDREWWQAHLLKPCDGTPGRFDVQAA